MYHGIRLLDSPLFLWGVQAELMRCQELMRCKWF
jgi:hypothetical protein